MSDTPSPAAMRAAKAIADAELTFLSGSTATPRAKHVDDEINAIARIIDAEMGTAKVVEAMERIDKFLSHDGWGSCNYMEGSEVYQDIESAKVDVAIVLELFKEPKP